MPTLEVEEDVRARSSMLHWFPALQRADVHVPVTEWVGLHDGEGNEGIQARCMWDTDDVHTAIELVGGPPAFIRTDQASSKHWMGRGSRVSSDEYDHIDSHVAQVIEFNELAGMFGLPYEELAVREWLELNHNFTAFNETPIASELRFFIRDGEIVSYGFYWPEDAIRRPDCEDWQEKLAETKTHALNAAVGTVAPLAEEVAGEFGRLDEDSDGYWSVDFAETEDGEWYAIDAAVGIASWHPDGCERPADLEGAETP